MLEKNFSKSLRKTNAAFIATDSHGLLRTILFATDSHVPATCNYIRAVFTEQISQRQISFLISVCIKP